jgi:hypothetical protein
MPLLLPGTPAVTTVAGGGGDVLAALSGGFISGATTSPGGNRQQQPSLTPAVSPQVGGLFGWLFPVFTTSRAANCIVYEVWHAISAH